jgi:hypothetical protein
MQVKAQNDAAAAQRDAINRQYANQMTAKREQNQVLADATQQYRPETRQDEYAKAQQDSTGRLMEILKTTAPELQGVAQSTAGNTGSDYDTAVMAANSASADKAQTLAKLLGRVGGQSDLFRREAGKMRTAENQGMLIGNYAQGQNMLDQMAVQKAGEVNPWLSMGGSLLGSYGANKLGSSVGAKGGFW